MYGPGWDRYIAKDCFVLQAHVRIRCTTVPGTGAGHSWAVMIEGQRSNRAGSTGYTPPIISGYIPVGNATNTENFDTKGGEYILINGMYSGSGVGGVGWGEWAGEKGSVFKKTRLAACHRLSLETIDLV